MWLLCGLLHNMMFIWLHNEHTSVMKNLLIWITIRDIFNDIPYERAAVTQLKLVRTLR